jgi:predicted DNA-binding mobile mystery protein A
MEINMLPNQRRLMRSQLEQTLSRFSALQGLQPPRGWIRAIREALGMSGAQLAARLGVTPPRVTVLERDEVAGAVSLKTLRQAAEALDCVLVYALVPLPALSRPSVPRQGWWPGNGWRGVRTACFWKISV